MALRTLKEGRKQTESTGNIRAGGNDVSRRGEYVRGIMSGGIMSVHHLHSALLTRSTLRVLKRGNLQLRKSLRELTTLYVLLFTPSEYLSDSYLLPDRLFKIMCRM